jgi:uncharacterized protein YybS (DUF2232 family)
MRRRSTDPRGLVFGGLMAALVVVAALVPGLGLFMPIPLVLAYVRYGGRVAALTALVATFLSSLFRGPVDTLFLLVPAGILPGLAFGYGFRHKLKPLWIGLIAVLIFFLSFAVEYAGVRLAFLGGTDPLTQMMQDMNLIVDQFFTRYSEQLAKMPAVTPEQQKTLANAQATVQQLRQQAPELLRNLIPSILFMSGVASAWLNYMLCRLILPRLGHEVPAPTPFGEFRLPLWMAWLFVGLTLALTFAGGSLAGMPWWGKVLLNVLTPLTYVLVLAGMAAAYGYLRQKGISKGFAVFLLIFAFFLGGLGLQLYILLAVWDTVFDFRGLGHGLWKRPKETP